jgi:uncharacterized protein
MLIELFGENFGCFRDEFRLSMLATDIDPDSTRGILHVHIKDDPEPLKLLRTVAIYGPNASGKSTVLRAAAMLRRVISGSRRLMMSEALISAYEPFAFGPSAKQPVRLGIKAVVDGHVYDYEIKFSSKKIVSERLEIWEDNISIELLNRDDHRVSGRWAANERFALLAKDFRPNMSILSLADLFMPGLARNIARSFRRLLENFEIGSSLWLFDRKSHIANKVRMEPTFANWLLGHLKAADIGISDTRTEEVKTIIQVESDSNDEESSDNDDSSSGTSERFVEKEVTDYRLSLLHATSADPVALTIDRESLGTQRLIDLAPLLYDLSRENSGRAAFADELDASLHPVIFKALIQQFNSETQDGKHKGQLIFATHETSLLDGPAGKAPLRRDQVYLTQKDPDGSARLYSVGDFNVRNVLNLRKRYLEGRYGAIPNIGQFPE